MTQVLLLTTDTVPGNWITRWWSMIWLKGSAHTTLTEVLGEISEDAQALGANAIVGLRIMTCSEGTREDSYTVYGTPVIAMPG
ncbi:heavy metal-binding domain-containing protein [Streptomyces sp. NPDC127038]|uniref:heavy metal-binding domain-containing protein n=1 Tax=Streptomyces sp. NPDC127038 TaxID=3347114 RepID=UPI00365DE67F